MRHKISDALIGILCLLYLWLAMLQACGVFHGVLAK